MLGQCYVLEPQLGYRPWEGRVLSVAWRLARVKGALKGLERDERKESKVVVEPTPCTHKTEQS